VKTGFVPREPSHQTDQTKKGTTQMEITILAIAALALATAPFGRAQDVESSPTAPDSTTSEVTATAPPEESATPAPERSAAPAAEKSAAPAAAKSTSTETKKATAATTATKSTSAKPAAAAAAPMKKMNAEESVKDMENRWEGSFMTHDPTAVQAMVANDFVGVYWDGKVMNRSGVLSSFKKDKDTYKSARNESLKVHNFGPNIAVVVGTAHEKGSGKDGKAFDRTFRFTDTWVERNGQWQCVASQVMKLKG
jgi:ketosteroid isomerase-like protein